MKSFVIESSQAFIKQFNGQRCSYDETKEPTMGKSGETRLYGLASGGGLFLRDDEVKAA